MAYWYNVITKQVEADPHSSPLSDLLGPYETEAAAAAALETARTKSEAYDEQWDDDDDGDNAGD